MSEMNPQHIVALTVNDFKRVRAVDITPAPDANTVVLAGNNAAGKSSVLDAIWVAVGGKRVAPDDPIRHGAKSATITAETEDLIITRRFTKTNAYLEVTRRNGDRVTSPQKLLDDLITTIGFDPLAFAGMTPKAQGEQLLSICPAEIDLDANAAQIRETYDDRRVANKVVSTVEAQMQAMPQGRDAVSDLAALEEKRQHLEFVKTDLALRGARLEQLQMVAKSCRAAHNLAVAGVSDLKERLRVETEKLALMGADTRKAEAELAAAQNEAIAGDPQAELDAVTAEIATLQQASNEHISFQLKKQELANAKNAAAAHDARLEKLREDRAKAIQAVKFPVDGLSFDDDGVVLYNGVALSQASTAEQIRVGIAVAAAAAPGLRVCFIRDGSLLDETSMADVAALAQQHGLQVWIERVADDSPAALQIVDGTVAKAEGDHSE